MSESESANVFHKIDDSAETGVTPPARCTQISDNHHVPDTTSASPSTAKESVLTLESKTQASEPCEAVVKDPGEAEAPASSMLPNPAPPVTSTVTSASMAPSPQVIVSAAPVRSTTPLVVGARVVSTAVTGGQTSASHPGGLAAVMSNQVRAPAVSQAPLRAAIMALPRTSTSQQNVTVPRTTSLQLPANFQIPQGMVLIRSDSGQLMLVSHQALAQAQAQGLKSVPKSSNVTTSVRPPATQAPATSIIRVSLPSPSTTATLVKPTSSAGKAALKPSSTTGTAIIKPTTTGSTIINPTALGTGLKTSSITATTVIKATSGQKPPISTATGTISQRTITGTNVTSTSVVKSIGKPSVSSSVTQSVRPVSSGPRMISPNIPIKASSSSSSKVSTPVTVKAETLENVKKCKNFLITLMKLASSGTRSPDMAQNVRALVKDLLDGRLEAEEFTEKLYMELKSSPQPYLVPFLKRSLPAVRQLTPNSQLFIQQCEQPKASSSSTISSSTQKPSLSSSTAVSQPLRGSIPARPPPMVIQQTKGVIVEQRMTSSPSVVLPVQNHTQPKQPVIQTNTQAASGAFKRQYSLQASKTPSGPTQAAQTHNFKDSTSGSFRDDDDINDVASMAGVNVNEENARILASGSELVGTVVRSCRDEPFLQTTALQHRVLHIGNSLGVAEVNPDVLGLLSHATQERLRDLLEKLTVIAQHHNVSYRDDWRNIQTSDTRAQLKFLEQLEKVEKQRREEEERETLLRIAKSRSSSEDPEQLKLKQRAKEMQQLELAQIEHRDANLAALAALGPRKRKPLEASSSGTNQVVGFRAQRTAQRLPTRVTFRDLIFCMEQDRTLRHSLTLYDAFLR